VSARARDGGPHFAFSSLMKNNPQNTSTNMSNAEPGLQRDPDEWKTGDEPMTAAQRSYLETLCRDTGEEFDENLSKAEASKRIDELRQRSPRLQE
jgi:hypothetical protein